MKEQLCKISLPDIEGFEYGDVPECRLLKEGDWFLIESTSGPYAGRADKAFDHFPKWILHKKKEWVTPTDEDAKQRPLVEVRDCEGDEWVGGELLYVRDQARYPYYTVVDDDLIQFKYCRMKKEV